MKKKPIKRGASRLTTGEAKRPFECCGTRQLFEGSDNVPGCASHESCNCRHCGAVIGEIRCDVGYPRWVGEVALDQPEDAARCTCGHSASVHKGHCGHVTRSPTPDQPKLYQEWDSNAEDTCQWPTGRYRCDCNRFRARRRRGAQKKAA